MFSPRVNGLERESNDSHLMPISRFLGLYSTFYFRTCMLGMSDLLLRCDCIGVRYCHLCLQGVLTRVGKPVSTGS